MEIKDLLLSVAIGILLIMVVVYGINTFYESREYDDFCGERGYIFYENKNDCEINNGVWIENLYVPKIDGQNISGYCQPLCQDEFEKYNELRAKVIFVIALILGIFIIFVGSYFFKLNSVGAGFMMGGIGVLIYGIGGYWSYSQNLLRFLISLVGLGLLVFVAYRINQGAKEKSLKRKVR